MKIHLLSDLHMEFSVHCERAGLPVFHPDREAVAQSDVIVLAGDIHNGASAVHWIEREFAESGKPVVYVPGNHEYYGSYMPRTIEQMREAADAARARGLDLHLLLKGEAVIGGVRFLGTTLWVDFELLGQTPERRIRAKEIFQQIMYDCQAIKVPEPIPGVRGRHRKRPLTANNVLQMHRDELDWLAGKLDDLFDGQTVVVTHHLPSTRSIAQRWRNDASSVGFACSLPDSLLVKADLWLHGHTHDSIQYSCWHQDGGVVRETLVACNPRGYPLKNGATENPAFDATLIIDL